MIRQDEKGYIYEALLSRAFNEVAIQTSISFTDNAFNRMAFWEAIYKWVGKEEIDDAKFFSEKANNISFWAIESRIPKEFARAVWRRSKPHFNIALSEASLFAASVRYEKENKEKDGDLFSS